MPPAADATVAAAAALVPACPQPPAPAAVSASGRLLRKAARDSLIGADSLQASQPNAAAARDPLNPDTPPRSPSEGEHPPRRKRRRVQQPRQSAPQLLSFQIIGSGGSALHSSLAEDLAMPDALAAGVSKAAAASPAVALVAPAPLFRPAASAAAAAAAAASAAAATTSLGTLGPPPIPLFLPPPDGVTTRRRSSLSASSALTEAAREPASVGARPAPKAAAALPEAAMSQAELSPALPGFASFGRSSPLAPPLQRFLPHLGSDSPIPSADSGLLSDGGDLVSGAGAGLAADSHAGGNSRPSAGAPAGADGCAGDCSDYAAATAAGSGSGCTPELVAAQQQRRRQHEGRPMALKSAVKKEVASGKHGRRVSFAPGPLPNTEDGHPAHEGQQTAARAPGAPPPAPLVGTLTPAHVHRLEVELGGENLSSVNRLKRRAGLMPPLKRERIYATPQPAKPAPARTTDGAPPLPAQLLQRLGGTPESRARFLKSVMQDMADAVKSGDLVRVKQAGSNGSGVKLVGSRTGAVPNGTGGGGRMRIGSGNGTVQSGSSRGKAIGGSSGSAAEAEGSGKASVGGSSSTTAQDDSSGGGARNEGSSAAQGGSSSGGTQNDECGSGESDCSGIPDPTAGSGAADRHTSRSDGDAQQDSSECAEQTHMCSDPSGDGAGNGARQNGGTASGGSRTQQAAAAQRLMNKSAAAAATAATAAVQPGIVAAAEAEAATATAPALQRGADVACGSGDDSSNAGDMAQGGSHRAGSRLSAGTAVAGRAGVSGDSSSAGGCISVSSPAASAAAVPPAAPAAAAVPRRRSTVTVAVAQQIEPSHPLVAAGAGC